MAAINSTVEPQDAYVRQRSNWTALTGQQMSLGLRLLAAAAILVVQAACIGQTKQPVRSIDPAMQQHYDAAYRLQDAGKLELADAEHRKFLAAALHHIANGRANLGEYDRAAPLYEDALQCAPDDDALQLDFAASALDAGDWTNAKTQAQSALDLLKTQSEQARANATLMLAQALWGAGQHMESLEEFKAAAALKPDFNTRYALARTYLSLSDKPNAVEVFAQLSASQGDTATLHMQFGRAYALANLFPEAVEEFKKAIAKDSQLQGVHYSLGAAYMQLLGEQGYPQAEAEFRRELALHPNDTFSYPQLGTIEVSQHKLAEAEADFKHALRLNPSVPGTYYSLGQLYSSMGKSAEAETALRNAVAVMIDPTRNNYEGQRIHYALGRLLLDEGKTSEAKEELRIAESLLSQSRREDASLMGGDAAVRAALLKTHEAKSGDQGSVTDYERKAAPLIAGSYNNLGVHAAIRRDYASATGFFEKTAQWNPTLHGIDNNLGRAAFLAGQYKRAIDPLNRALATQPEDAEARAMLGLSYYRDGNYSKTVEVLRIMEERLDATPPLALAFADSTFRAGDRKEGLARLEQLAETHPDAAKPHQVLGEAYASNGSLEQSARELRTALQLDPASTEAKRSLATTLAALGQNQEALQLLSQLAQSESTDATVYLQLGQLRLKTGDITGGLVSLQTSSRLAPGSVACHQALAEAYRRNSQPEEAKREEQLAETLQGKRSSAAISGTKPPVQNTPPGHTN
jgi:tetratricopeptide (TPR) repeat protein